MSIAGNIASINSQLPENVRLVAVSKTKTAEAVYEAYDAGQRIFGENYVQELIAKQPLLPADIEWHFIGHLQTNKVKYIAPFVKCIQSVDSEKLLKEIDKEARKNNRVIDILLEISIAADESKFGFEPDDNFIFLRDGKYKLFQNVRFCGVMGMGSFSDQESLTRIEYRTLKIVFNKLKANIFTREDSFCEVSMGMSLDYKIAIEEGSTLIRVGTSVFGERVYNR
ncbi:Pyridoxal phosphate homeostasis protein [bioreactor metagenome]|uniref:Pyridoxal phosphate homeostasis protein n=1 Tax=bioreactor metagenome TaxID=1076179 RepID=A0A644ZP65_9ZZZZ